MIPASCAKTVANSANAYDEGDKEAQPLHRSQGRVNARNPRILLRRRSVRGDQGPTPALAPLHSLLVPPPHSTCTALAPLNLYRHQQYTPCLAEVSSLSSCPKCTDPPPFPPPIVQLPLPPLFPLPPLSPLIPAPAVLPNEPWTAEGRPRDPLLLYCPLFPMYCLPFPLGPPPFPRSYHCPGCRRVSHGLQQIRQCSHEEGG